LRQGGTALIAFSPVPCRRKDTDASPQGHITSGSLTEFINFPLLFRLHVCASGQQCLNDGQVIGGVPSVTRRIEKKVRKAEESSKSIASCGNGLPKYLSFQVKR
jgi:hypothetical protein